MLPLFTMDCGLTSADHPESVAHHAGRLMRRHRLLRPEWIIGQRATFPLELCLFYEVLTRILLLLGIAWTALWTAILLRPGKKPVPNETV